MWVKEKARERCTRARHDLDSRNAGLHMKATSDARHALNSSTQAGIKNACSPKTPLSPFAH
jgi:hypothetical protein